METSPSLPERQTSNISIGGTVYVKGVGAGRVTQINNRHVEVSHPQLGKLSHDADEVVSPSHRFDFLTPAANSPSRKLRLPNAIFILIQTMVGASVVSLPYAFRASGIVLSIVFALISAISFGLTVDLLIATSRGTGANSYDQLANAAFGRPGRMLVMWLLVVLIWLILTSYLVLIADLLCPVITWISGTSVHGQGARAAIIGSVVCLISPLLFQKSLSSLKFMAYVAFTAICIVVSALVYRGVTSMTSLHDVYVLHNGKPYLEHVDKYAVALWPDNWGELLYAYPLFGVSYSCHINVLPMHAELAKPTRARTRWVIFWSFGAVTLVYLVSGFAGYVYTGKWCCGNILLNFASSDVVVNVARMALACSITGGLPLFLLPCRENLHQLICSFQSSSDCNSRPSEVSLQQEQRGHLQEPVLPPSSPPVHVYHRRSSRDFSSDTNTLSEVGQFTPIPIDSRASAASSRTAHVLETLFIILSAVCVACLLDSVLVVLALAGATVNNVLAYIYPAAMWLKLHRTQSSCWKVAVVQVLLVLSIILAIACTVKSVASLNHPPCPWGV